MGPSRWSYGPHSKMWMASLCNKGVVAWTQWAMQNNVQFKGLWEYELPSAKKSRAKLASFRQAKLDGLVPSGKRSEQARIKRAMKRKWRKSTKGFVKTRFGMLGPYMLSVMEKLYGPTVIDPKIGEKADAAGKLARARIDSFIESPTKSSEGSVDEQWEANIKRRGIYVPPGLLAAARAARERRKKPLYDLTKSMPPVGRVIRSYGNNKNVYINIVGGRIVGPMRPVDIPAGHHKKYWYFLRTRGTWYTSEHHPHEDEPEIYAISDIPKE